jgi:thiol-disulfide isomerase/thioredoxin
MKKSLLLLAVILISFTTWAQTNEVCFRKGSVAEILAQAKAENKPVFIDAYTVWCGPCKWMDKNVFADAAVANYFNSNFVNYKLDMEKDEGIELSKKYNISAYPSFLFINHDGSIMHRTVGARPAEIFLEVATIAKDPTRNYASYQKKFNAGERSTAFMLDYLRILNEAAQDAGTAAEVYFATQNPEQLLERGNWNLIYYNIKKIESPVFAQLVKNKDAFAEKYTADSVNTKILEVYENYMVRAAYNGNSADLKKHKANLANLKIKHAERSILYADAIYFERKQDIPNYHAANVKLFDTYYNNDAMRLNNIAWKYFETVEDKAMLQKAEEWVKQSISITPNYSNMDTLASLLYKLGQKDKARYMAEKAITEGKKTGEDVKATVGLLQKINKM